MLMTVRVGFLYILNLCSFALFGMVRSKKFIVLFYTVT
jgi:hypothetical protein